MMQTLVVASLRGNRMCMLLITDDIPLFQADTPAVPLRTWLCT